MSMLVLLVLCGGAYALSRWMRPGEDLESIEARAEDQLTTADVAEGWGFSLTIGDANGTEGFGSLRVEEDGRCVYRFATYAPAEEGPQRTVATWRQARFEVSEQIVRELRRILVQVDYPALKAAYSGKLRGENMQRFIKVQSGGRIKGVFCDNGAPVALREIHAFLEARVIGPHREAIAQAPLAEGFGGQ